MHKQTLLMGTLVLALSVALGACSGSGGTPQATGTPATATTAVASKAISGTVRYAGAKLAAHKIIISAVLGGSQGAPGYSAVITAPGPYTLANVADGSYVVIAFIDTGDDMGPPGETEPLGWYDVAGDGTADPVVIAAGGAATGIDIAIKDR
jgi:hypothetical protein